MKRSELIALLNATNIEGCDDPEVSFKNTAMGIYESVNEVSTKSRDANSILIDFIVIQEPASEFDFGHITDNELSNMDESNGAYEFSSAQYQAEIESRNLDYCKFVSIEQRFEHWPNVRRCFEDALPQWLNYVNYVHTSNREALRDYEALGPILWNCPDKIADQYYKDLKQLLESCAIGAAKMIDSKINNCDYEVTYGITVTNAVRHRLGLSFNQHYAKIATLFELEKNNVNN